MIENNWAPRPQKNVSAPNYVINEIKMALLNRQINPGDRLPSELELASMFNVSRGSIRQAMKSLETLGIISIRPGDGTYINTEISEGNINPLIFSLLISRPSAKQMVDARYALERDIIELILANTENIKTVIPKLEENVKRHRYLLNKHAPVQELVRNDQFFHKILSDNCGNMIIKLVYDYIMESFEDYLVMTTARQMPENENVTIRDHEVIIKALVNRSFNDAKQAVKQSSNTWYGLMNPEKN